MYCINALMFSILLLPRGQLIIGPSAYLNKPFLFLIARNFPSSFLQYVILLTGDNGVPMTIPSGCQSSYLVCSCRYGYV